jgi:16S rRNA (cytosine1402-N4)-methyltransferase
MSLPIHIPVLLDEVTEGLQPQPGGYFVDCTVGLGGHAAAILDRISLTGRLLGIDADPEAIEISRDRLRDYGEAVTLVNDNFVNLEAICERYRFHPVDGILFDLGISSLQLDTAERGFSFHLDAPLNMRFDSGQGLTASDIVKNRPIATTVDLAHLIEQVSGAPARRGRIHPATRTFMALRIAVNSELQNLEPALKQTLNLLRPGGRLAVITYHSLEDRIVKQFMRYAASNCLCPPGVLICRCGHVPALKLISRKVIKPTSLEIESNPRSRSAKLRIAERLN